MSSVVISGTGLYAPPSIITNEELVASFNAYVLRHNQENQAAIERGELTALKPSSCEFIEKASGIKQRHVVVKDGLLAIDRMMPLLPKRGEGELCYSAEMAVAAARQALAQAGRRAEEIDFVLCGASTSERPWPAVAIEIQKELGCVGFAFDMTVACATATFALSTACDAILSGMARKALVINPELMSPQINYRDRDSHFIFGDAATACLLEREEEATASPLYRILNRRLKTSFSYNIHSHCSFTTMAEPNLTFERFFAADQFFVQRGRKVFRELLPMICETVEGQLHDQHINIADIKRLWLHQANINMNNYVARQLLGREASREEAPVALDEYANAVSAGSIIAFHKYRDDLQPGDLGLICSFGAGYSIGSIVVRKVR
ncbi:MAG: beta-ketoacyl-ACP synthase III [Desulfobulbaceae bacterium]|jgi:beta-ketodecanoyl-[acyl-carrier-protein] synthase|nr:beta-ketoacyl-ACP synthase III [Desulfobulbaceae bacterium]